MSATVIIDNDTELIVGSDVIIIGLGNTLNAENLSSGRGVEIADHNVEFDDLNFKNFSNGVNTAITLTGATEFTLVAQNKNVLFENNSTDLSLDGNVVVTIAANAGKKVALEGTTAAIAIAASAVSTVNKLGKGSLELGKVTVGASGNFTLNVKEGSVKFNDKVGAIKALNNAGSVNFNGDTDSIDELINLGTVQISTTVGTIALLYNYNNGRVNIDAKAKVTGIEYLINDSG